MPVSCLLSLQSIDWLACNSDMSQVMVYKFIDFRITKRLTEKQHLLRQDRLKGCMR